MLTITRKTKKIYIKLLTVLTIIFAIAGVAVILGTVGASDLDIIPFSQIIKQAFFGFLLCGIAWVLNFIKNALQ